MEFKCKACGAEVTTADVARQTLAVSHCIGAVEDGGFVESHAGPFEVADLLRSHTRPENVPTRNAVEDA